MKQKNLKTKILLTLSGIIISVASAVAFYTIVHEKHQNTLRMEEAYRTVHLNYKETIKEIVRFYTARAYANIHSPQVLKAFVAHDRNRLYQLILPRWKVISQENPALIVMQFHNADGTSLLRMHHPNLYGDPIAAQRPMVAYIHQKHTRVYGFEEGQKGIAFRILVPIFDQKRYVGAIEFGLSASYINDTIYRHTGYDAFFFVRHTLLGNFSNIDQDSSIGNYQAIDVDPKLVPLVKRYQSTCNYLQNCIINEGNQTFAVSMLPISNYLHQPIGAIVFIRAIPDFWDYVWQTIMASGLIALSLLILLGWIISRIYDSVRDKMTFQEFYSQTVLDAIPSPVIVTDGYALIAANKTFLSYFQYPEVADFKQDHACVCEYFQQGDTQEYLMPMLNDQRWTEYMAQHPTINHKAKIIMEDVVTIFDVKLSLLCFKEERRYVVIFTDISSIQSISMTDPLTGLANRLHFSMVYDYMINVSLREQQPLGIIFFDIDHFKHINDQYGHLAGDKVLKHLSHLLQKRLRKSDIAARWGGEEFVILLPDTALEAICQMAESLRSLIAHESFEINTRITCSFGATILKEDEGAEGLLKRADGLLYQAKEGGRNRVIVE